MVSVWQLPGEGWGSRATSGALLALQAVSREGVSNGYANAEVVGVVRGVTAAENLNTVGLRALRTDRGAMGAE